MVNIDRVNRNTRKFCFFWRVDTNLHSITYNTTFRLSISSYSITRTIDDFCSNGICAFYQYSLKRVSYWYENRVKTLSLSILIQPDSRLPLP